MKGEAMTVINSKEKDIGVVENTIKIQYNIYYIEGHIGNSQTY